MKITVSIYKNEQLNLWASYLDAAILNHKDISLVYDTLDLDAAIKTCIEHKVEPILAITKMLYPKDLKEIEAFILKYQAYTFLATDIAVYQIARRHHLESHIIYDPQTMITNKLDLSIYSDLGFKSVSMSLEIPLKDVIESQNDTKTAIFYQIFGHRLMFYSKRKLISLYEEHAKLSIIKNKLYLKETTREDYFPVIENQNGTVIYRSYLISLLKHYKELSRFSYGYLESLYVSDDTFIQVLEVYSNVFQSKMDLTTACETLNSLNLKIEEGFTTQDSVYQKELF